MLVLKVILLISIVGYSKQNTGNLMYSPSSFSLLNFTSDWTPLSISVANSVDLVFVSCGFDGISVIDRLGSKVLQTLGFNKNYINTFQITNNGIFLFVAVNSVVQIYEFEFSFYKMELSFQMKSLSLLQEINFSQQILSMLYVEQLEVLIVAGNNGLINTYDTINKAHLLLTGTYTIQYQQITGLFLSKDFKWLFVSAYYYGLVVLKLEQSTQSTNQKYINFLLAGYGVFGYSAQYCIASSDFYIYCFDTWTGLYYSNSQHLISASESEYPLNLAFTYYWPSQQTLPSIQQLTINQAETQIFVGVRSYGLYILDISKRSQIQLYQQIYSSSLVFSISFSKNEDYLYLTNASQFFTFQQIQVNLNDNFPNLFNLHQARSSPSNYNYKFSCYLDSKDEYFFGAFDNDGMFVFPIHKNPYRFNVSNFVNLPIPIETITFDDSGKYLMIPEYFSDIGLGMYQYYPLNGSPEQQKISPMNMKLIKTYPGNASYFTELLSFSLDRTIAVLPNQIGVIIYNSSDIFNMQIYAQWNQPDFLYGFNIQACVTHDNNWIVGILKDQGTYLLNIKNITNPILVNYFINYGGSSIQISKYYNYVYLIDGAKGFAIIDTSFFPKFNIVSRISILGYAIMGLLLQKEEYILIAQSDIGMLTLLDIRDPHFPFILNTVSYQNQHASAVCSCNTMNQIFITTPSSIITMPSKSAIQIHTNVSQIKYYQSSSESRKSQLNRKSFSRDNNAPNITNEYIFKVGQIIELDFEILYPVNVNMKITNVFFYQNGIVQNIPTLFSYSIQQQRLLMNIDQSLLGSNQSLPNINILLIKTSLPFDATSFIYNAEDSDDLGVTSLEQSSLIFSYLSDQNILNSDGTISDFYDFFKPLILNVQFQNQLINNTSLQPTVYSSMITQITQKIEVTLKRSYYLNPFKFYVISSLVFDNLNKFSFISTSSLNAILLTLQVNGKDGKLLQKSDDSVSFQMSQSQDQLIIQGTLENVNKVLQQRIIFANSTYLNETYSPKIDITVNDGINFPLKLSLTILESNFIVLKKQLQLNQHLKLQNQLNQQYSNGVVDIESDISISFSSLSFIVNDSRDITYLCFYYDERGNFTQIPPNLWLQQSQNDKMNFKGTTTSSNYGQTYRFKIIASDGYTSAEDYFTISIKGIPFTYALNLLLKILGPLIAVVGMYQKRFVFYNIIFKNRVTFSKEEITNGKQYYKQLIIIGRVHEDAIFIVRNLFKLFSSASLAFQKGMMMNNKNDSEKGENGLFIDEESLFEKENNHFDLDDEQQIKQPSKYSSKIPIKRQQINLIMRRLKEAKGNRKKSLLEREYLNEQGRLILSKAISDIVAYKIKPESYSQKTNEEYVAEVNNRNSVLQRSIRALMSHYFLRLDKQSYLLYDYIRYYCFWNGNKNHNDWFKAVVKVEYNKDFKNFNNKESSNIFPQLELKYPVLFLIFKSLNLIDQNEDLRESPTTFNQFQMLIEKNSIQINLYLIREVLFADAVGFPQHKPSDFYPSVGQAIHLDSHHINQIVAYKKRKIAKWILPIYRALNLEYCKYGFSKNMRLPTWLHFNQKNGIMILEGTPQKCDIEEILIKIFDVNGYVIQQFLLNIVFSEQFSDQICSKDIDLLYSIVEDVQAEENPIEPKIILRKKSQSFFSSKLVNKLNQQCCSELMIESSKGNNRIQSLNIFSPKDKKQYQFLNSPNTIVLSQCQSRNEYSENTQTAEDESNVSCIYNQVLKANKLTNLNTRQNKISDIEYEQDSSSQYRYQDRVKSDQINESF